MKLFYDDIFDALQRTIADSPRSFKECAAFLRPDLKPESAYAWLKACVNADGDQSLKFQQIVSLAKFCGRFDALFCMADELAHQRPQPANPRDEMAELQRRFIESVHAQRDLVERMERTARRETELRTVAAAGKA